MDGWVDGWMGGQIDRCKNVNAEFDSNENVFLNRLFTENDITVALQALKNNKACGHDQVIIINEFLKASASKLTRTFTKLFNLIVSSGETPTEWSIGIIKPLFKQL